MTPLLHSNPPTNNIHRRRHAAVAPAAPQYAVQDEITEAVTIAIAPAIAHAEQHRAMRIRAAPQRKVCSFSRH
jgi:hypothetical protein